MTVAGNQVLGLLPEIQNLLYRDIWSLSPLSSKGVGSSFLTLRRSRSELFQLALWIGVDSSRPTWDSFSFALGVYPTVTSLVE